jgi:hypothetical protein
MVSRNLIRYKIDYSGNILGYQPLGEQNIPGARTRAAYSIALNTTELPVKTTSFRFTGQVPFVENFYYYTFYYD